MSYDLAFWADTRSDQPEPSSTYTRLSDGDTVDGIDAFDAAGTFEALRGQFPGLTLPEGPRGHTSWEDQEGTTVFEFAWSPQHLTASARGSYTSDQMNAVIDAAIDVGGGRLYDPQVDERFA